MRRENDEENDAWKSYIAVQEQDSRIKTVKMASTYTAFQWLA